MDSKRKSWLTSVGIVAIAAVMVEVISIIQYERLRKMMAEDMAVRSHIVLGAMANDIQHTLELTETTMKENLWDVSQSMSHPDSVFPAMKRLIDDNPHVVGGCLAFVPYYYPSKGRLFEPYASKEKDGTIVVSQIAGPGHDYTENAEFIWTIENQSPSWTDPYLYGPDSLSYATYSCPVWDSKGRLAGVCGLDIDLSWLGDTLNANQRFASSFSILLTEAGQLVAGPPESRTPPEEVQQVVAILNGVLPESANPAIVIKTTALKKDPYWKLAQVFHKKEIYARMKRMRRQQMVLILLGLAILAFMLGRYSRNERKLRKVSEEQARVDGELEVARNIQKEMIPRTFPPFVYGSLEPAREVGGDLFDFYIRDGKLFFCIGDVSGKGVPSAMLMSVAHSLFRIVSHKEDSPSRILQAMNQQLCQGNDSCMFMTFFAGCLDLYSGELYFGNAGHDKPILLSDGIDLLQTKSNFPLGVFPDTRFEEQSCTLAPGSILFMYTDGLTEAKNTEHKAFARDRVTEVLNAFPASGNEAPLETLVSSLSDAAHRFAGAEPQSDDLTMLAIRFNPEDTIREQIILQNEESEVTRLGVFVKGFLGKLELDAKTAAGLRLALEESVVNVIEYAYPEGQKGDILIQADSNHKEVRFTITDSGTPFDPTSVMEADVTLDASSRPIGGLGVLLSRKLTDSFSYSRRNGQNVLTLTKSIL